MEKTDSKAIALTRLDASKPLVRSRFKKKMMVRLTTDEFTETGYEKMWKWQLGSSTLVQRMKI